MSEALSATDDTAALKAREQDFSIDKAVDRYLKLLCLRHPEEHYQKRRCK